MKRLTPTSWGVGHLGQWRFFRRTRRTLRLRYLELNYEWRELPTELMPRQRFGVRVQRQLRRSRVAISSGDDQSDLRWPGLAGALRPVCSGSSVMRHSSPEWTGRRKHLTSVPRQRSAARAGNITGNTMPYRVERIVYPELAGKIQRNGNLRRPALRRSLQAPRWRDAEATRRRQMGPVRPALQSRERQRRSNRPTDR